MMVLRHHVVLLLLLLLALLLQVRLLEALLWHLLVPIHVGHILLIEIRRRVGRGEDMIRDLLCALVEEHPRLLPFRVVSEVVLAGVVELRVDIKEARL